MGERGDSRHEDVHSGNTRDDVIGPLKLEELTPERLIGLFKLDGACNSYRRATPTVAGALDARLAQLYLYADEDGRLAGGVRSEARAFLERIADREGATWPPHSAADSRGQVEFDTLLKSEGLDEVFRKGFPGLGDPGAIFQLAGDLFLFGDARSTGDWTPDVLKGVAAGNGFAEGRWETGLAASIASWAHDHEMRWADVKDEHIEPSHSWRQRLASHGPLLPLTLEHIWQSQRTLWGAGAEVIERTRGLPWLARLAIERSVLLQLLQESETAWTLATKALELPDREKARPFLTDADARNAWAYFMHWVGGLRVERIATDSRTAFPDCPFETLQTTRNAIQQGGKIAGRLKSLRRFYVPTMYPWIARCLLNDEILRADGLIPVTKTRKPKKRPPKIRA